MKVIALAYIYPPDSGSGTFRSLFFFNHIAARGNRVAVITAREEDFSAGTSIDPKLTDAIHPDIKVIRAPVARPLDRLLHLRDVLRGRAAPDHQAAGVHERSDRPRGSRSLTQSIKDAITDALSFPDHHVGWLRGAYRSASREIRTEGAHCIYSSGGPWTSHLLAILLKKRFHLPVVLDFRDPWAANPDLQDRGAGFRWLTGAAERFCVRNADHVVLNTEALRRDFIERYPEEGAARFTTITNGFEEQTLAPPQQNDRFTLVHTGEIYLSRDPACFLRALRQLVMEKTMNPRMVAVQLVGGCARNAEIDALLGTPELNEVVQLVPRVPHRRALEYQLDGHVLLLFQTGFPLQIPRKLFEYMSMSKPVLAITEQSSATADLVRESGVGVVATQDTSSIALSLRALYGAWLSGEQITPSREQLRRYRNDELAGHLLNVLKQVGIRTDVSAPGKGSESRPPIM